MIGEFLISFYKKKVDEIFADYQHYFTREGKKLFDQEELYWEEFFWMERLKNYRRLWIMKNNI